MIRERHLFGPGPSNPYPEATRALAEPLLAIRPSLVWLQMGIRDPETARRLTDAGIPVVMDRCLMAEHPSLVVD